VVQAHDRAAPGTATSASSDGGQGAAAATHTPPTTTITVLRTPAAPGPFKKTTTPKFAPSRPASGRNASGRIQRSASAKRAFQASHPCPSTGATTGACRGYVIDHVKPLACGGMDNPSNMQWQIAAEAKAKDKWERVGCGK
jgi:hypothetical protein